MLAEMSTSFKLPRQVGGEN